ncbi:multidrug ABC transporter ATP-binding and permease protein [Parolsenella catena]|uniref:Multidrug ABC transporter ATP-binding and permease protein n=3 Tax=Parolsenella catena TaxID=2003188 RepID=A0A3G9K7M3_9ACTN|nr:ABC transporter ATP-binding protein [Parolsenella catena]BBH50424.1 multidrug ABC transporter ATP-binding and permease protein [Parolsenella catena]
MSETTIEQELRREAREGAGASWRASIALLGQLVSPYRGLAAATFVAMLFDLSGMLLIPTQLSAMINTAVTTQDANEFLAHGALMLAAALVGSFGYIASTWLASRLCANVGRDLRMRVYRASLAFSAADFNRFGTGSMITRTLSDANVVQQTLLMTVLMILPVPIMCAISVGLAFSTDFVMGWVLLAVTLVTLSISLVAIRGTAPVFTRLQGFIDAMNARLREAITGVRVVRAFGREELTRERLDETFDAYARNAIRVNYVFATTDLMTFFLMNGVESLTMWLGANRVGAHAMQIGSISALIEYAMLIMFFMMMAQFAMLSVPRALACLGRAAEVLAVRPEVSDAERCVEPDLSSGVVARFDHASLRYADADEDTLRNLDFSVRRGQVCAIIGNTGSGKSTVAKMLLRFCDATEGRVLLGDADVRDVSQQTLREHVAYVPQKAWLFSGTIAENLRHGRAEATDEELWHALDVAQAGFVRELPDGLGARVAQGGTNFSGGQRQRLAIARALVRHADLYVFDDSFSALDFKTDAALRHALAPELARAATLIIAQRVSTIREADQIVVLKDGQIVGLGGHDELMGTCETYRAIAQSQARKEASRG